MEEVTRVSRVFGKLPSPEKAGLEVTFVACVADELGADKLQGVVAVDEDGVTHLHVTRRFCPGLSKA